MIGVPNIRLVDENGEHIGVVSRDQALMMARERNFDLVEISPDASPPVCKIMDFGKFKYEKKKRDHESKRKQKVVEVKEIKLRPKTDVHDRATKTQHAREFLDRGDKVRVVVAFRGREMAYPEIGARILDEVAKALTDYGTVERPPQMEGRMMAMIITPLPESKRPAKKTDEAPKDGDDDSAPGES